MRLKNYIVFFNFVLVQIIMLERVLQPTPKLSSYQSSIDSKYDNAPSPPTKMDRAYNDSQTDYYMLIGLSALLCVITVGSFCYSCVFSCSHEEGRCLLRYTVVQNFREVDLPCAIGPDSVIEGIDATNEVKVKINTDVSPLPIADKAGLVTEGIRINSSH